MKITHLRFKNLNSLIGEWSIDFTAPEYVSDGIFTISGPTGAGKSTILDAICLALYGCTPRLEKVTANTNEIMSRQTGECFAEVVFETREGAYRAFWSHRRARGKATGELQQPSHEISEIDANADDAKGKILAAQLKQTALIIEQKTGMDFKRFTQSMMLAQGGFAAFLKASGNERAPILEQITGTEIYSRISIHVFQKDKEEKQALEVLKSESSGLQILPEDEVKAIESEIELKNQKKVALSQQVMVLTTAIEWFQRIASLESNRTELNAREDELQKELAAFEPSKRKLENATKAAGLDAEYATLTGLRARLKSETRAMEEIQKAIPSLENEMKEVEASGKLAEKAYTDKKKERDTLLPIVTQVRKKDQTIVQKESELCEAEKVVQRLETASLEDQQRLEKLEKEVRSLRSELHAIADYQTAHAPDETLRSNFSGISATFDRLQETNRKKTDAHKKFQETEEMLNQAILTESGTHENCNKADLAHIADLLAIEGIEKEIKVLLDGKTIEILESKKGELILQIAELRKTTNFEDARKELSDDKPCPLCGSIHHPYATGNIPGSAMEEQELTSVSAVIQNHAVLVKKRMAGMEALQKSKDSLTTAQTALKLIVQTRQLAEISKKEKFADWEDALTAHKRISEELKKAIGPLGIAGIPGDDTAIQALKKSLRQRMEEWVRKEERKMEVTRRLTSLETETGMIRLTLQSRDKETASAKSTVEIAQVELAHLKQERAALFGDKSPDSEEGRLAAEVIRTEEAKDKAAVLLGSKENALSVARARFGDLAKSTRLQGIMLSEKEVTFAGLLSQTFFGTEEAFLAARLVPEEKDHLMKQADSLVMRKNQLEGARSSIEKELAIEKAKNITTESPMDVAERQSALKQQHDVLLQEVGSLNGKLAENELAKARGQELFQRIAHQKAESERWTRLSSLIGSADGKKYRNFAQGLTLELMVSYANRQLEKLSDRYLLIRDKADPLDLNVVDNYQAGEIRSTKNLSGGESFIVSLALALGLSGMSSRTVRIDSLFLDEGFGTLDDDTLETILGTLASLRQEGKVIGVISHVGAMKERINAKITVTPVREGKSEMEGPGVRKGTGE